MRSIINTLRSKNSAPPLVRKLIGTTIGICLWVGGCDKIAKVSSDKLKPIIAKRVATHIINETDSTYNATRLLLPFLKDNPQYIDLVESSNAAQLRRLHECISTNTPPSSTTNNFPRVSTRGFRVDIDDGSSTKTYFSDDNISQGVSFYPKPNVIFTRDTGRLYFLPTDSQVLNNRVGGISQVLPLGEDIYIQQGNFVYKIENGKLIKAFDCVQNNGLERIQRTPFGIVFRNRGIEIIGENTHVKQELESALTNVNFIVESNTKVLYEGGKVFMNDRSRIRYFNIGQSTTNDIGISIDATILDYTVLKHDDKTYTSILGLKTTKDKKADYFFETRTSDGIERVSADPSYDTYRFPENPTLDDIIWQMPHKIEEEIRGRINGKK